MFWPVSSSGVMPSSVRMVGVEAAQQRADVDRTLLDAERAEVFRRAWKLVEYEPRKDSQSNGSYLPATFQMLPAIRRTPRGAPRPGRSGCRAPAAAVRRSTRSSGGPSKNGDLAVDARAEIRTGLREAGALVREGRRQVLVALRAVELRDAVWTPRLRSARHAARFRSGAIANRAPSRFRRPAVRSRG